MAYWIATASADHVRRGRREGIMQVCHGKGGPLARTRPGDGIVYYSPTVTFRGTDRLQALTAIGRIVDRPAYAHEMTADFVPMRRDVEWWDGSEVPIHPLLDQLEFTRGRKNWGYAFRFGLMRLSEDDFVTILDAMAVSRPQLSAA